MPLGALAIISLPLTLWRLESVRNITGTVALVDVAGGAIATTLPVPVLPPGTAAARARSGLMVKGGAVPSLSVPPGLLPGVLLTPSGVVDAAMTLPTAGLLRYRADDVRTPDTCSGSAVTTDA